MPSNIAQLKRDIRKFATGRGATNTESPPAVIRQIIVSTILSNLAKVTPIRTGRLNGGWLVGVGRKPSGVAVPFLTARVVAARNSEAIDKITATNRVFITNNVPYAGFVEFGTRRMAPRAYTQRALQAAQLELRARGIKVSLTGISISLG